MSEFIRREMMGRKALLNLQQENPDKLKWPLMFNPDPYGPYDAYYFTDDKLVWIEIKIRDKEYDTWLLEKSKLNNMINESVRLGVKPVFLYLNFTPNATYIWNITNIKLEDFTDKIMANKSTSISRTNKILKDIIYLNIYDGIKINFKINENRNL